MLIEQDWGIYNIQTICHILYPLFQTRLRLKLKQSLALAQKRTNQVRSPLMKRHRQEVTLPILWEQPAPSYVWTMLLPPACPSAMKNLPQRRKPKVLERKMVDQRVMLRTSATVLVQRRPPLHPGPPGPNFASTNQLRRNCQPPQVMMKAQRSRLLGSDQLYLPVPWHQTAVHG